MNNLKRPRISPVRFAAALAQREMTCGELASLSGVSRGTISAIRAGKRCRPETAEKIAAVLGQDIYQEGDLL